MQYLGGNGEVYGKVSNSVLVSGRLVDRTGLSIYRDVTHSKLYYFPKTLVHSTLRQTISGTHKSSVRCALATGFLAAGGLFAYV